MVRRQRVPTFQAAVPGVLGKVRDVGYEHPDSGREEEQRCHPAANERDASDLIYCRESLGHSETELTASPSPSRA